MLRPTQNSIGSKNPAQKNAALVLALFTGEQKTINGISHIIKYCVHGRVREVRAKNMPVHNINQGDVFVFQQDRDHRKSIKRKQDKPSLKINTLVKTKCGLIAVSSATINADF